MLPTSWKKLNEDQPSPWNSKLSDRHWKKPFPLLFTLGVCFNFLSLFSCFVYERLFIRKNPLDFDMAQIQLPQVETDPDFEPLSRPRSCTWPLPRPEPNEPASSNTSSPAPSVQQEPGATTDFISNLCLLEEDYEEYGQKPPVTRNDFQEGNGVHLHHHLPPPPPPRHHHHHHQQQQQRQAPQLPPQQQVPPPGVAPQRKSSSSRRNAWGNMSYADLITKAIESSPEKRLTLSQIYDWMVKSVPYFKDKGDSNSSAGWKVSDSVRARARACACTWASGNHCHLYARSSAVAKTRRENGLAAFVSVPRTARVCRFASKLTVVRCQLTKTRPNFYVTPCNNLVHNKTVAVFECAKN